MPARLVNHAPTLLGRTAPLWLWPAVAGVVAVVLGTLSLHVDLSGTWANLAWPGSADAALAMVQTVASSIITVTTLVFTLTVVALQLASQQFSPRLLREFTRDPVVRGVLSVLVATFVLALTVLRGRSGQPAVPAPSTWLVFVMGLASVLAVLAFITHLVRLLRIDTMMLAVNDETDKTIARFYPSYDEPGHRPSTDVTPPEGRGHVVVARHSGFVRTVDVDGLLAGAEEHDLFVQLLVRPGDHATNGSPLAQVWRLSGGACDPDTADRLVESAVERGYERTMVQDVAFGFRQLEDIAVKALSPAVNDPATAVHAIGHMADLLTRITQCRLGGAVHRDSDGVDRVVVPDRDLAYFLDLACGQARRYGSHEPTVLVALLRLLRDTAASARDDRQREDVEEATRRVAMAADPSLSAEERGAVEDMQRRVELALCGEVLAAYTDRSGETRSV